ncbi:DUF4160 domain-containing protein [Arundinibacter roseus]|uniref:DUF4160 domain-containing protein n=1 Tax=Arundinibacter roseus TaxID=2070510 RepID=A0A4R4KAY6_9BACT|nr:DUF4160 domain-containing protein [Arundinibacter roseus]
MPCIKTIDSIKIYIYARDHSPPHFHVLVAEHEELIIISNLSTYSGSIPTRHRKKVIEWASKNPDFLLREWNKLNVRL